MKSSSSLTFLLALGLSHSAMAQATTVVYQDNFDDENINTNSGIGGSMFFFNRQGPAMAESAAGLTPIRNGNNDRGNATSANSFSLVGGFQLTVEFTIASGTPTPAGSSLSSQFGLSSSENVVLSEQNNTTYAQSFLIGNNSNSYAGLGIIPIHNNPSIAPGLYHSTGDNSETIESRLVDSAQNIPTDEALVMILRVNPDSTYSYSINEETASEGTLANEFDFTQTYHFHLYDDPVTFDITFDPSATSAIFDVPGAIDIDLLELDTDGDGIVQVIETATTNHLYELTLSRDGVDDTSTNVNVQVVDPALEAPDNAFSSAVEADLPLFYYRFEEATGSAVLFDSSANGNHADNLSNIGLGNTPTPGGLGNTSSWTENGFIFVPATSDLTQSYTFMTMLNLDDFATLNNRRDILSMAQGTGVAGTALLAYNPNGFVTAIGGGINTIADTSSLSSGDSCLVHFVYDSDPDGDIETNGGEVRLYLNGVLAGSLTATSGANIGNWILASTQNLGNLTPLGSIDEAALFESALTEAQITAHSQAFFAAADPLLGFTSDVSEIDFGEPVVLQWKVSDAANTVTINGSPVDGVTSGGVFTTSFFPTENTTYTVEVNGTITSSVDIIVNPPLVLPGPPVITSFSSDNANPPNITIEFSGIPNTDYILVSSPDLATGFDPVLNLISTTTTDASGVESFSFIGIGSRNFYRVQEVE